MARPPQTVDVALKGNNAPCPGCALRREMQDLTEVLRPDVPCNLCHGLGVLPIGDAEIARIAIEEARRIYWPLFYARTGTGPDRHQRRPDPRGPEPVQLPLPATLGPRADCTRIGE